jgi:ATP-dependent DNA helicase RecQ
VPAYVIFDNRNLTEIARRRPSSPVELREVPGVGEKKLAAYGDAVLELLAPSAGAP